MAKHVLHFGGLKPKTYTWFYNRLGGPVRIHPGNWVVVDDEANPFWHNWLDRDEATEEAIVPDGVDYLDEDSQPQLPGGLRQANTPKDLPRGALSILGPPLPVFEHSQGKTLKRTVAEIGDDDLEQVRLRFMPCELPGIGYTDARPEKRRGQRVAKVPPPFEFNFLILLRLAWLRCRRHVERKLRDDVAEWEAYSKSAESIGLPPEPAPKPLRREIRSQMESATAEVMVEWGLLRGPGLPSRATLFRQLRSASIDVRDLDVQIMNTWFQIAGDRTLGLKAPSSEVNERPLQD